MKHLKKVSKVTSVPAKASSTKQCACDSIFKTQAEMAAKLPF